MYCPAKKYVDYNDEVVKDVAKLALSLEAQMKSNSFNPLNIILIIAFLHTFKRKMEKNVINQGRAMQLVSYFTLKQEATALTVLPLSSQIAARKDVKNVFSLFSSKSKAHVSKIFSMLFRCKMRC